MRIPSSTYRLQLKADFPFEKAKEVLPYLQILGVSHVYLSPIFAAKPGSTHGYDVVSMTEINEELGGRDGFEDFTAAATRHGLEIIQDIVPNHRAFHGDNKMLMDVLEQGPYSKYYHYYDIAWDHTYSNIRGRLLAPFLGDFYGRCLERKEIKFAYGRRGFTVNYYEMSFPLNIASYNLFLRHNLETLTSELGHDRAVMARFHALINFIQQLDEERSENPDFDYLEFVKEILWELYSEVPEILNHVDDNLAIFNGERDDPESFDLFDAVMAQQYFRLSYWKVGTEELNYRRFFSINDLISLRVEEQEVFEETHRLVFELVEAGKISGVRVDHVDGLYDPGKYLKLLRQRMPESYIVVEKILESEEKLPGWPIHGTTGYEFMDRVAGILCDDRSTEALETIYRAFSHFGKSYEALVLSSKRDIIGKHMAGDIDNLALMLKGITNRQRIGNDLTMYAVRRVLVEILTHFSVYRCYISKDRYSAEDHEIIAQAVEEAKATLPLMRFELELVSSFFLSVFSSDLPEVERDEWTSFLMRLQQYTGPLMAKGVEDTAFYVYNRLICRNEVGSSPLNPGFSVEQFHEFSAVRQNSWPNAMNSTATHDTKRGEDARARLYSITEDPAEWNTRVFEWHKLNTKHKTLIDGRDCPSRNDEYHIYQAILGSLPLEGIDSEDFLERLKAYLIKAVRESKVESSWLTPNEKYEKALLSFSEAILNEQDSPEFLKSFTEFFDHAANSGLYNSLSQTIVKLTAPGLPDTYQGTELWDFSFVDPDNRRPVDFTKRAQMLSRFSSDAEKDAAKQLHRLLVNPEDGGIKLYVINALLKLRRVHAVLFEQGEYIPLSVEGPAANHILTFARSHRGKYVIVIVTRLIGRLFSEPGLLIDPHVFEKTVVKIPESIQANKCKEALSHREVEIQDKIIVSDALSSSPVGVLISI